MAQRISFTQALLTYPQCTREKEELLEWLKQRGDILCAVVCKEDHHETDGTHLHAWIKMKTLQKTRNWSSFFDWNGIHGNYQKVTVNPRSIADTVTYVTKDGDFEAWNCNVDEIKKADKSHSRKYNNEIILTTNLEDLVDQGIISVEKLPVIRRGKDEYFLSKKPGYTRNTKGIWLWGDAGVGKTKWCERFGKYVGSFYEKPCNKWFDGYKDEEVIIMDEVKNNVLIRSGYLMKWADNSPCKGEVKGGMRWLRHRYFLVTSNDNPEDLCRDEHGFINQADWEPLARRFKFIHVTKEDLMQRDLEFMPFRKEDVFENEWCTFEDIIPDAVHDKEDAVEPPAQKRTPDAAPPVDDQPPVDDTEWVKAMEDMAAGFFGSGY